MEKSKKTGNRNPGKGKKGSAPSVTPATPPLNNATGKAKEAQDKVFDAFNTFIDTCVIGNGNLLFDNRPGELMSVDNISKCIKAYTAAQDFKKNPDTAKVKTDKLTKNSPLLDWFKWVAENDKTYDAETIIAVYAHFNWLYALMDNKTGKVWFVESEKKLTYLTDKEASLFFIRSVSGFGQSVSSYKNDAVLSLMAVVLLAKQDYEEGEKPEKIKAAIDELAKKATVSVSLPNQEPSSIDIKINEQARKILLYLCNPVKFDMYGSNQQADNSIYYFPITTTDTDAIYELALEHKPSSEEKKKPYSEKASKILEFAKGLKGKIDPNADINWLNPFYSVLVAPFWRNKDNTSLNELNALRLKKAIVLYGPPGTSKTYQAKALAHQILRAAYVGNYDNYLTDINNIETDIKNRIHRLQLHPNYSYEDFVWGYRVESGTNGSKTVAKGGYLLKLIAQMEKEKKDAEDKKEFPQPHVLILDEINRIDLSRLFGELFSAIENRGEEIDLPTAVEIDFPTSNAAAQTQTGGQGNASNVQPATKTTMQTVALPDNLYIIGTMNEIDFSLERVDFALRRRFVWLYKGYDKDVLTVMLSESKMAETDIETYVNACTALNDAIDKNENLGKQYEIGHTIFAEIRMLINDGMKYADAQQAIWNISVRPMLEAFLGNMGKAEQDKIIGKNKEDKDTFCAIFFGKNLGKDE